MMKNSRLSTIVLSLIFGVIAISGAQADLGEMIQDGIDYLEANQDETSGLWSLDKDTPYRDGMAIVDVLARLEANYTVDHDKLMAGYNAVNYKPTLSTDYLARKIMAQASVNDGFVDPDMIDSLVNMQNTGGSWGYQKGYGSNTLETALAIKALVAASFEDPDPSVLTPAANFLVQTQNTGDPDYGWGFIGGGESRILFTAHAVTALSALQDNYTGYDFSTQIDNAFDYLQGEQHENGGFGSGEGLISNAYETGLAICAMIAHNPGALEIQAAWGYLENTQSQEDGGWNDDAYSTAMAISGLNCIDPDAFLYEYLPGDANMYGGAWPPVVNGLDVSYLQNYFKGNGDPCYMVGPSGNLWASADVNASCSVNGMDLTYLIAYLKGGPAPLYCIDFEPAWPPLPPTAPPGWPNCYTPLTTSKVVPMDKLK